MFHWLKKKPGPIVIIAPPCPAKLERPDAASVSTSILGPGSGFHRSLTAILGDAAGLCVRRQVAQMNGCAPAERFEVEWEMYGGRYVVRGVCQQEIALGIFDILDEIAGATLLDELEEADESAAIEAFGKAMRKDQ